MPNLPRIRSLAAEAGYFVSNLKLGLDVNGAIVPGAVVSYDPPAAFEDLAMSGSRRDPRRLLELVAMSKRLVDPEDRWGPDVARVEIPVTERVAVGQRVERGQDVGLGLGSEADRARDLGPEPVALGRQRGGAAGVEVGVEGGEPVRQFHDGAVGHGVEHRGPVDAPPRGAPTVFVTPGTAPAGSTGDESKLHHSEDDDDHHHHDHFDLVDLIVRGNDTVAGGLGDDVMMGDRLDVVSPFLGVGTDVVSKDYDKVKSTFGYVLEDLGAAGHEDDDDVDGEDGASWNDSMTGGDGNDIMFGGAGRDTLSGGLGDDHIVGNKDKDVLDGGLGKNKVIQGSGEDGKKFAEDLGSRLINWGGHFSGFSATGALRFPSPMVQDFTIGLDQDEGADDESMILFVKRRS